MLLFIIGALFCSLLGPFTVLFYCSVGLLTGSLITTVIIVITCGIFIRLFSWGEDGYSYEVLQYISFTNRRENYRCICDRKNENSRIWSSCIYTTQREEWAYFDITRKILQAHRERLPQKILLLGGGGGSLAYTISKCYPTIHIDIVEISKQMIYVAKRYFLRASHHEKITWIHRNALAYVKQSARAHLTYDCVIVDLFNNDVIPEFLTDRSFVQTLHKIVKPDGLLFINFGWQNIDIKRANSLYTAQFNEFRLYLYGKSVVGVNWLIPPDVHALLVN